MRRRVEPDDFDDDVSDDPAPRRRGLRRLLLEVALVLALAMALRWWVGAPHRVGSDSMAPTLRAGDVVVVQRAGAGAVKGLHRGDLVTFRAPDDGLETVKRVVGLPGDEVAVEDAVLVVNGRPVDEPYVDASRIDGLYYGPVKVPLRSVLVMGDNRSVSVDSRDYGPVKVRRLTGRVLLRVWPLRMPARRGA